MTTKIDALLVADEESIGPGVGIPPDVAGVILVVGDDDGLVVGGSVASGDIGVDGVCSLNCALGKESHAKALPSVDCKSSGILGENGV